MSVITVIQQGVTEVVSVPNPVTTANVTVQVQPAANVSAIGITERITITKDLYQAIAGETLSGNRVVYIEGGKAYYYDPSNTALYGRCLGITTGAALVEAAVTVQLGGVMEWTDTPLTPGSLYYAGLSGQLTTNPTGITVLQRVGHAIATNQLKIDFSLNVVTI
jgi:hypothetical protein